MSARAAELGPPAATQAAGTDRLPAAVVAHARASGAARTRRLLLATDLGEASASATDQAVGLAPSLGASLLAVSVIDPGSLLLPGGRYRARIDQVRERLQRDAEAVGGPRRRLGGRGV